MHIAWRLRALWLFQVAALWLLFLWPLSAPPALSFDGADKLVHAALFAWLAVTGLFVWRSGHVVWCLILLGGLIELTQAFTPFRSADPLDWLADSAGVLLVWLGSHLCRSR